MEEHLTGTGTVTLYVDFERAGSIETTVPFNNTAGDLSSTAS